MGAEERKVIKRWLYKAKPETKNQETFLRRVQIALDEVQYDFFISNIEPSLNENGDIFFKEGTKIITDINCHEWKACAERFYKDSEWHSELADLREGDLLKAYKIATGYWSLYNISESRAFHESINEVFRVYDGFAIVKNCYDGPGRYFMSAFDYLGEELANVSIRAFGVVTLKRNL